MNTEGSKKATKTQVRMTKAFFDGYYIFRCYTKKYHIMVEMDTAQRLQWPYFDFTSLCGSYLTSTRAIRRQSNNGIKWKHNKYKCKRCDKFYKKSLLINGE